MKSTIVFIALTFAQTLHAQQENTMRLDEAYGDAFTNYLPYAPKKPEAPNKTPPPTAAPTPAKPAPAKPKTEKVNVEWLKKNFPILQQRAIDDPSAANMEAYLYIQRIIMDKASRFGDQHMMVVNQDPMLNENNRIPYASSGSQAITSAQYTAQEAAVKELSKIGGLIAFVDSKCRFCAMQLPVLEMMRANHGLETLVVSIDGKRPGNYKGPLVTDNGLYKKLDLMLTPSVVFVPKPKAYAESDPNTYLIISQGFYAADQMTKMIAYAGHHKQLLSANTMKELDVWQRGIASTQDLQNLELDINDPQSFKEKLRPILAKQYQR